MAKAFPAVRAKTATMAENCYLQTSTLLLLVCQSGCDLLQLHTLLDAAVDKLIQLHTLLDAALDKLIQLHTLLDAALDKLIAFLSQNIEVSLRRVQCKSYQHETGCESGAAEAQSPRPGRVRVLEGFGSKSKAF